MSSWRLKVKIWGVRGSIPTPYAANLGYGGNTPCLEIRLPNDEVVIFDAGTGVRQLGRDLKNSGPPGRRIHMFLTHFHWDHIHGLPFFTPLYEEAAVSFFAGCYPNTLQKSLAGVMAYPYFPIDFSGVAARCEFHEIGCNAVKIGDLTVQPFPVNHPQGACGFRAESGGACIVYVPDREHGDPKLDAVMRQYAEGADILVHDAQYTPEEYKRYRGWGHSTWLEAAHVARDCRVRQLILFHHDPDRDDTALTSLVADAATEFPNTVGACEGWVRTL